MRTLLFLTHVMTMSMTLVTSVEPFVQTFATSVNCHNGFATIKKSSWTSAWLCTVLVVSAVRNSQVGWSVKATKMLANCTVVSQLTEKIQRLKGSFWDGKMYVFDERIAVDINHVDPIVVG